jgi:signal transduction histidine kinase
MTNRAAAMGGSCRIESGAGGTAILIEFPVKE